MSLEIERKFIIKMPDINALLKKYGDIITIQHIEQTYLNRTDLDVERRIRKKVKSEETKYLYTEKTDVAEGIREENEVEITEAEYEKLLLERDFNKSTIIKERYVIPYKGRNFELDVYEFWNNKATLEIELKDIKEKFEAPPELEIIADVTEDKRFSNSSLASNHQV